MPEKKNIKKLVLQSQFVTEDFEDSGEKLSKYKDEFYKAKYAGLACGLKNTGIGNGMPDESSALITIVAADKVIIDHGWTEMGQGVNTIATQVVCEETGIDPAIIEVRIDTIAGQVAGMTTASRATSLVGNALIDACKELKKDLESSSLADLAGKSYRGFWIVDWTTGDKMQSSSSISGEDLLRFVGAFRLDLSFLFATIGCSIAPVCM